MGRRRAKSPDRLSDATIRATLLRLLILGGTKDCGLHERGVWLEGGWIEGALDLSYCSAKGRTFLRYCHFESTPDLEGARLKRLEFDGSSLPGLWAEYLTLEGALTFEGACIDGTVVLTGADIGGKLSFDNQTTIIGKDGRKAIQAQRLKVAKGLFFRDLKEVSGRVDLTAARIGDLVDNNGNDWPKGEGDLILDGFTYERLSKSSRTDFSVRREWLSAGASYAEKGTRQPHFNAQPYTQLARALRQAGHVADARKVLIERTYIQGDVSRTALRVAPNGDVWVGFLSLFSDIGIFAHLLLDRIALWVAGYGYAPHRALLWALACVGSSFFAYMYFWCNGAMVPTSDVVLSSFDWWWAMQVDATAPTPEWSRYGTASHYETFYSLAYAVDVFLPIVDLGQQSAWGQTTVTWAGWWARIWTWILQAAGYIITSLGLAAATGIIQRNQPD